jgi:hypothetical protein
MFLGGSLTNLEAAMKNRAESRYHYAREGTVVAGLRSEC